MTYQVCTKLKPYSFRFTEPERRVFRAKEKLTVSQWAELYRYVESGALRGPWSNSVTPYAIEPMDCWTVPYIRRIILDWAPQTAKTQVAFNCLAYSIDQDPGPAMYVMPDEKVARRISRRRLIPMFKMTPRIRQLLSPRFDDTSTMAIRFQNGMDLMMAWASSSAEIASEAVRYLLRDEICKWPTYSGKEANPMALTDIRTNSFPFTKKILDISTPALEGDYMDQALQEADEIRRRTAECLICHEHQIMEFDQIKWPKDIRDPRLILRKRLAHYQCKFCGMHWDDYMRNVAVANGRWIADVPVDRPEVVAFHLPGWYSPFTSLSADAAAFMRGQEDRTKLMVFVTQHKAEHWKETVTTQKENTILSHKTDIPPLIVPPQAIALTAFIDTQKHNFWFEVEAWAEDLTSWTVLYGELRTWDDIETLIYKSSYRIQDSEETMEIWRAGIDTGGGLTDDGEWTRTEEVYQWLRNQPPIGVDTAGNPIYRVYGTKGASHADRSQVKRIKVTRVDTLPHSNKPIPGGLELRLLDTAAYKTLIHWRLDRKEGETQRVYFHSETGEDYARQILAEEARRTRGGKVEWVQIRKANHLLDCRVGNAALADDQWLPSLRMLAPYWKKEREQKNKPQAAPAVARSKWMQNG